MLFLTDELELITNNSVLYFYAHWMPFHEKMVSMISKLEKKYNYQFIAIDVDYFKPLLKRFKVESIPTIIAINNSKELSRLEGLILTSALKAFLNTIEIKLKVKK